MITQALKRWLNKLFGWLSWKKLPETEYARVGSLYSKDVTQETVSRTTIDGIIPQFGAAPLIAGQGEASYSTVDEWPERVVQSPAPALGNEKIEPLASATPTKPPQETKTPPGETAKTTRDSSGEALSPAGSPTMLPVPTPEQKLEFLQYLVKRGLVNEGFPEGQFPEQYRK